MNEIACANELHTVSVDNEIWPHGILCILNTRNSRLGGKNQEMNLITSPGSNESLDERVCLLHGLQIRGTKRNLCG